MLSLIADVGGTNTRLAWAKGNTFEQVKIVPTAAATNFLDIVDDYLQERRVVDAEIHAAFAVAGPVRDGEARLTNEAVSISASELHSRFGFANVAILNDFAALAYALPHLSGAHCLQVGGGQARLDEPKLVLGPGTGFGTSLWVPDQGGQQARVLATEAGHALLAPANETEARVLAALRDKGGPVSIEDVVSGRGIERIYETMGSDSADFRWQSAAEIFEQREHDPVAGATVGLFFSFLGLAARALALTTGAQGGVYVAGGIVPRYLSEFSASPFRSRFETPAPIGNYLPEIPTFAITHPYPALLGLAAYSQMSFS